MLDASTASSDALREQPGRVPWLPVLLLTAITIAVHGYHLGADDAAIYVPGIKQAADPALYPFGGAFFQSHAHLSVFPAVLGLVARAGNLSSDWVIFGCHVFGIFLLLAASWRLVSECFEAPEARWGGTLLVAFTLALPVAGTALAMADPYVTARTLSTPTTILAIASYLGRRPKESLAWWLLTMLVHPQMGAYAAVFLGFLMAGDMIRWPPLRFLGGVPFLFELKPARGPARVALFSRTYFFVSQWAWYEYIGVIAPIAILAWFALGASPRGTKPAFKAVVRGLVPFGLLFTLLGVALSMDARLENYTRLQPMRAFHLLYVILALLLGALTGEYVLQRRTWRWLALFVPLGLSMFLLQRSTYPASAHVEWPGMTTANQWTSAFLWIRANTPNDAVFAIDPDYMARAGEDMHGFRAIAERSTLADATKDSGAVALFPALAQEWQEEVKSATGWRQFKFSDFKRLARHYPVTWFVTDSPGPKGMLCPYDNATVAVCRFPY